MLRFCPASLCCFVADCCCLRSLWFDCALSCECMLHNNLSNCERARYLCAGAGGGPQALTGLSVAAAALGVRRGRAGSCVVFA